jgi:peptidoglycan/LPS O-acetylase OafA/YrhL
MTELALRRLLVRSKRRRPKPPLWWFKLLATLVLMANIALFVNDLLSHADRAWRVITDGAFVVALAGAVVLYVRDLRDGDGEDVLRPDDHPVMGLILAAAPIVVIGFIGVLFSGQGGR